MRKLIYLFIIFTIFSCSKDEVLPKEEDLIGTWDVTSIDYTGTATVSFMGMSSSVKFTGAGKNIDLQVSIEDEPKNFISTGGYDIELSFEDEPPTVFENESFMSGTWNLDGKNLTVTQQGEEPQKGVIKKLTPESMILYTERTIDMMGMGTYTLKGTFNMVKQQ